MGTPNLQPKPVVVCDADGRTDGRTDVLRIRDRDVLQMDYIEDARGICRNPFLADPSSCVSRDSELHHDGKPCEVVNRDRKVDGCVSHGLQSGEDATDLPSRMSRVGRW